MYHAIIDSTADIAPPYQVFYVVKDHLGNTRVVFSDANDNGSIDTSEINQISNYYPFGAEHDNSVTGDYAYRYNGKEKELGLDLEIMRYGARNFDLNLIHFDGVDPLADLMPSWSPYQMSFNNPVRYVDIDGLAPFDIIDIDTKTGNITVTEAAGDDVVRLVNDGKVEGSYTYGSNGSFTSDNQILRGDVDGTNSTALITTNGEKAQTFFEFASKSEVEFGKLDVEKNEKAVSIVTTTHEPDVTSSLGPLAKELSSRGFTGVKQSHSHPDGQSVPSGHYDNVKGNPSSLMPVPVGSKFDRGDAPNARQTRLLSGFGNTKFEVYNSKIGRATTYDGVNRAVIKKR